MSPTYVFTTPGAYTVTLNVTDAAGNWNTDAVIITVVDTTNPIANAGSDQTVNVGQTVTFDGGGSSDNVGIVSYEWDFGDGTTGTGVIYNPTYTESGTYTVMLTVKDAAGNIDIDQITVTVLASEPFPLRIAAVAIVMIAIVGATLTFYFSKAKKTTEKVKK